MQKSETARIDIDPHAKILPAENRFLIEQQQTLIKTLRTDFGFIFDGNRKGGDDRHRTGRNQHQHQQNFQQSKTACRCHKVPSVTAN
ncbi:Uncharacterised protein [Vibrio cholerae]|nr:Uncharacterised protein [Vibrio cholerae]